MVWLFFPTLKSCINQSDANQYYFHSPVCFCSRKFTQDVFFFSTVRGVCIVTTSGRCLVFLSVHLLLTSRKKFLLRWHAGPFFGFLQRFESLDVFCTVVNFAKLIKNEKKEPGKWLQKAQIDRRRWNLHKNKPESVAFPSVLFANMKRSVCVCDHCILRCQYYSVMRIFCSCMN